MPYSPRYLMQQAARGKPCVGSPEQDLRLAIESLDAMEMDRAFFNGASRASTEWTRCFFRRIESRADPFRAQAAFGVLIRHRAIHWDMVVAPQTRECAASRLSVLASGPLAPRLLAMVRPIIRWNAPSGLPNKTVAQVWAERVPEHAVGLIPLPRAH